MERAQSIKVPPTLHGVPVEQALLALQPDWTPAHAAMVLRQGRVQLDGVEIRRGSPVRRGARLTVQARPPGPRQYLPNRKIRLVVVHEDEHLAVLEKPAGIPMHPGPGHGSRTILNALLARYGPAQAEVSERAGIVHRLDRDVSGLVVVARTEEARRSLISQFRQRAVEKEYAAGVCGIPPAEGEVDRPVAGSEARTLWQTVAVHPEGILALLAVHPVTGRMHQIRVHLASVGHPIVGDEAQGGRPARELGRRLHLRRPLLHARRLGFSHPATGEPVEFHSRLPRELYRALRREGVPLPTDWCRTPPSPG